MKYRSWYVIYLLEISLDVVDFGPKEEGRLASSIDGIQLVLSGSPTKNWVSVDSGSPVCIGQKLC